MFSILRRRDFDFCKYLLDAGFKEKDEYPFVRFFLIGEVDIAIYQLKNKMGYNTVTVDFRGTQIANLKFIPTSKKMSKELLAHVMREVNELSQKTVQ